MYKKIKTILISPHSDDIAFSIGGSLLQNFFMRPILMVTIFSRSNYSPCIKINNSEIISKVRNLEDVDFADKLDIEFQSFNFSEPILRGHSRRDIFANKNPTSDPIYLDVYYALSKLINSYQCKLIVSPMGLGNHMDHINACDICKRIAKENNIRIIYYEDLHYASQLTLRQIRGRANSIDPNLEHLKINITTTFNDKIENIKLYKSQARRIFQTLIKSHALRLGIENKSLKELILSFNLFKYLLFLFTNKSVYVPLYERIWLIREVGDDEHSNPGS
jgi:LmbE family N-acetylglucosaminyl deacetylase